MAETVLDLKGLACPLPVLRANKVLRGLGPGERLRVLATDRASVADFHAYCRETGHALIAWSEEAGVFSFVIRRRADDPKPVVGNVAPQAVPPKTTPPDAAPAKASP